MRVNSDNDSLLFESQAEGEYIVVETHSLRRRSCGRCTVSFRDTIAAQYFNSLIVQQLDRRVISREISDYEF
jgi:hypothetical protein